MDTRVRIVKNPENPMLIRVYAPPAPVRVSINCGTREKVRQRLKFPARSRARTYRGRDPVTFLTFEPVIAFFMVCRLPTLFLGP